MISEKIKEEIRKLDVSQEMKDLMLKILDEEDKGTYKYKDAFDKLVNNFIKEEDKNSDNN